MSGHRSHGHYIAKGGDLAAMTAEFYGKATGCTGGRGGSMHLIDIDAGFLGSIPMVGSTIPIAVGAAFADKIAGRDNITVAYFGDAAIETGAFYEATNFAALHNLPVIFVCENNLYSVYSPMSVRQPLDRPIHSIAAGLGLRTATANGNDVLAVYQLAAKELSKTRKGKGPVFLEFPTYRWLEHCGPNYDNDIGYRTEEEFAEWKELCPVLRYEALLESLSDISVDQLESIRSSVNEEIESAIIEAKSAPFPKPSTLADNLFAGDIL